MATASPRSDTSNNHSGRLQLQVTVSSAKLKRKKNWFGTAIYTEVAVDGEIKKTAKSNSSSNPKWDEQLTVNVTPQTTLEFRVWSHHTLKADALLGRATIDLKQALLKHNRKLERVKEQLKLSLENKNGVVQTGELTVVLDGLAIELESLTNCSSPPTKIQQNGDALHENAEPSARTTTRLAAEGANGVGDPVCANPSAQSSRCSCVLNGDSTPPCPSQGAARPKNTPAPAPLASEPANDTVNGESPSSTPEDAAGAAVASEDTTLSPGRTSATSEDPAKIFICENQQSPGPAGRPLQQTLHKHVHARGQGGCHRLMELPEPHRDISPHSPDPGAMCVVPRLHHTPTRFQNPSSFPGRARPALVGLSRQHLSLSVGPVLQSSVEMPTKILNWNVCS